MTLHSALGRLEADLPGAVARRDIVAYFQPQISLATGRVVAIEGLGRWRHPELGVILPSVFIPLAEKAKVIHDLGHHMLRQCLSFGRAWQHDGVALEVAVNVSPSQLAGRQFFDELHEEMDDAGLDPHTVILEVTETQSIDDTAAVASRLDGLRAQGFTISIDDYGTGFSSAERVAELHATELKIDRSIVAGDDRGAVADAIGFAHERGIRVVGEGVETEEQLWMLAELGCDRAQGFAIAAPASRTDFEHWMAPVETAD
ncbi:EAL domain-containing protein [Leifsonia sp. NPDC058248]|uniref:EAL domain-containing protein n=1 Tax=Leifsonia sp. NPDC058248 TaxID=3346402 RepID=UPI0036D97D00